MGFLAFTKKLWLSDERGISIVEGMIGLGAIAGLAAVIANISTNTNNRAMIYSRACESMATNAIDAITDEGVYMDIHHFTPSPNKLSISQSEGINLFTMNEIKTGDLWQGSTNIVDDPVDGNSLPGVFRSEILVEGAMRALNALYNNAAGTDFCGDFRPYAPEMTFTNLGIENELTRSDPLTPPTIDLKLEMVNWQTNVASCPAKPAFIAPRTEIPKPQRAYTWDVAAFGGYDSFQSGDGVGVLGQDGITNNAAEFNLVYKWRLSARVNYTVDGQPFNCVMSRDFEYPADSTAPNMSSVSVQVVGNTSRTGDYADFSCTSHATPFPEDRQASVLITVNDIEPGSLLFCRDISEQMQYRLPGTLANDPATSPACIRGNGGNFGAGAGGGGDFARRNPRPSMTTESWKEIITVTGGHPEEDKWYPCHAARICGGMKGSPYVDPDELPISPVAARSAVLGANAELTQIGGGPIVISLAYDAVPVDCIIGLQVIAVDIAGNVSGVFTNRNDVHFNTNEVQYMLNPEDPTRSTYGNLTNFNASITAGGQATRQREMHRPWCGDRGATAPGAIGTLGSNTWGIEDDFGVLCLPAPPGYVVSLSGDRYTPNWQTIDPTFSGSSTNTALNPTAWPSDTFDENWNDEFPNGYYTCRPGGCCFTTDPILNPCTPFTGP